MNRRYPARVAALLALLILSIAYLAFTLHRVDPNEPGFAYDGWPAYDRFERLARYPGKTPTACPGQTPRSAVILAIGQSNIANFAEKPAVTAFPDRVFNFFNGACFVARSPLLGAGGERGEWLTSLGDELVRSGRYDSVTIAPAAIGGVPISRFAYGDLGGMLDDTVEKLVAAHHVTHVIWHQGESDFRDGTSAPAYRAAFLKIAARLRDKGITAPIFVSVATRCLPMRSDWAAGNDIARALRLLPGGEAGLSPGVDSDAFDQSAAQYDACHLSAAGEAMLAARYANIFARLPPP